MNGRDVNGNTALHQAVNALAVDAVNKLIAEGADVNARNYEGKTPLFYVGADSKLEQDEKNALEPRQRSIIEALVKAGVRFGIQDLKGWTAPKVLVKRGCKAVELMVELCPDEQLGALNLADSEGWTLAHSVASLERAELVPILQQKGVDFNSVNEDGATPLSLTDTKETIAAFLKAGASDSAGHKRLLFRLIARGDVELLDAYFENGGTFTRKISGQTAFQDAANRPKNEVMECLIKWAKELGQEGGIFSNNITAPSPLHLAVSRGNFGMVNLLLDNGTSLLLQDEDGDNPLHFLAGGDADFAEKFLAVAKKQNPDAFQAACAQHNEKGECPVHKLVKEGSLAALEKYIKAKGPLDVKTYKGESPLHLAIEKGDLKKVILIVEALVASGQQAALNAKNNAGDTPLHSVIQSDHPDAEKIIDALLRAGADVNQRTFAGSTPLHLAADQGKFALVYLLVTKGAEMDIVDIFGSTPLGCAVRKEKTAVVNYLREKGAKEMVGATPPKVKDEHAEIHRLFGELLGGDGFSPFASAHMPGEDDGARVTLQNLQELRAMLEKLQNRESDKGRG